MTESVEHAGGTISSSALDLLVLTAKASHAAEMISTARGVIDEEQTCKDLGRPYNLDHLLLAREVHFDARVMLAEAREALVDRGADVQRATLSILGLSDG